MNQDEFSRLFLKELRDVYSAEKQVVVALPKMKDAAFTPELKKAFDVHLVETKAQITRLEEIFVFLNENLEKEGEFCSAMKGIIEEIDKVLYGEFHAEVKDAALIAAAQRVEHYQIACYGVLRAFAKMLELSEVTNLLEDSLKEAGYADKHLTAIAEGGFFTAGVNERAREGKR